jgi:serine/threonine protein kinase
MMPQELETEELITVLFVSSADVSALDAQQQSAQLQSMYRLHVITAHTPTMAVDLLSHNGSSIELVLVDIDPDTGPNSLTLIAEEDQGGGEDVIVAEPNIQLLEQICHNDIFGGVPVIALTHSDDLTTRRRCSEAGAREILLKPLQTWHQSKLIHWGRVFRERVRLKGAKAQLPSLEVNVEAEHAIHNAALLDEVEEGETIDHDASPKISARTDRASVNIDNKIGGEIPGDPVDPAMELHVHSAVGTLHYLAPEVILDRRYGECIDWWACGVTFFECIAKTHLFNGTDKAAIVHNILHGAINIEVLLNHSKDLHELVKKLLQRTCTDRLGFGAAGAKNIKNHRFFRNFDWDGIVTSEPKFKPAQMPIKKQTGAARNHFFGISGIPSKSVHHTSGRTARPKQAAEVVARGADGIKLSAARKSRVATSRDAGDYEVT